MSDSKDANHALKRLLQGAVLALLLCTIGATQALAAPSLEEEVAVQQGPDPGDPSADPYAVAETWSDIAGREVVLRFEALGKANGHNLTSSTVRRVTQLVDRVPDGGSSYRYETVAERVSCSTLPPDCQVLESQLIRVVVDDRPFPDGKPKGVVTAYCPAAGQLCPSWVNEAING
jgi:hypothetical protein